MTDEKRRETTTYKKEVPERDRPGDGSGNLTCVLPRAGGKGIHFS